MNKTNYWKKKLYDANLLANMCADDFDSTWECRKRAEKIIEEIPKFLARPTTYEVKINSKWKMGYYYFEKGTSIEEIKQQWIEHLHENLEDFIEINIKKYKRETF